MPIYKFCLEKTFHYQTTQQPAFDDPVRLAFPNDRDPWLYINSDGRLIINKQYAWDGCSPKLTIFDLGTVGTPDGVMDLETGKPKTYFASLTHDALYQFADDPRMPYSRKQMDLIFLELLEKADFSLAKPYYYAVRCFGGITVKIKRLIQRSRLENGGHTND